MWRSQNLPLSHRIYPPFNNYMRYSQNVPISELTPPPFPTTICYIPRIYPSVTEYSPFLELHVYVKDLLCLCESIYYMRPSQNIQRFQPIYAIYSQNLPLPLEIYPFPVSTTICYIPRIYPSVTEYAPFSRTTCTWICERIYHSLPELKNILRGRGKFWEGRI